MLSVPRHLRSARWPFWLLLAAWFCANSPQSATYALVVWMGNARNFSHQQRLTSEVAFILAGKPEASVEAIAEPPPARPQNVPLPADATLKKFDLFVVFSSELIPPSVRAFTRSERPHRPPAAPDREPPSEPPRSV